MCKKVYWRLLRLLGMQQYSWNSQYRAGVWKADSSGRSPATIERVKKLCKGGLLVEFGCGEGSLPCSISHTTYAQYVGIDISDVAIERAKARAKREEIENYKFIQADMSRWDGVSNASLILLEECLYYLKGKKLVDFLERCCANLAPDGHILVIVHSARKHAKTLEACRKSGTLVKEEKVSNRIYLTLTGNIPSNH